MKKILTLTFAISVIFVSCNDNSVGSFNNPFVKYKIAYSMENFAKISVINNDGTNNHTIATANTSGVPFNWASDNKYLIFSRYIYISDSTGYDSSSLWKVNVYTSEEKLIVMIPNFIIYSLSVSPLGNKIAFTSQDRSTNFTELHVINIDGSSDLLLAKESGLIYYSPVWQLNGEMLLFIFNNQIYRIKPDKTGLQQLTDEQGDNSEFSISPDGQKIVFNNIENYNSRIFIMNFDGTDIHPITPRYNYLLHNIQWSSDGKYFVFTKSDTSLSEQIFRMDSNGGNIKQLTFFEGGNRFYPDCTPDGKIIYYSNITEDLQIIDMNGENKKQLVKLDNSYVHYFVVSGRFAGF